MTIKTLEYIHALLIEKEQQTKEVYKASRKLQHEYEESETAHTDCTILQAVGLHTLCMYTDNTREEEIS